VSVGSDVGRAMQGSVYVSPGGRRVEDAFTPATRLVGVDRQGLTTYLVNQAAAMGAASSSSSSSSSSAPDSAQPAGGAAATGGGAAGSAVGGCAPITFHFNALPQLDLQRKRVTVCSKHR
jgi:hypothetical protein